MSVKEQCKHLQRILTVLCLGVCFTVFPWTAPAISATLETANVMAPLYIKDAEFDTFEQQLSTVKNYGVDAVSVDIWWGDVEGAGDNSFNWSYYDTIFAKIKAHGLKIVPILSFHQCGGNVGDDCNIPLPPWLWTKYTGQTFNGMTVNDTDLQYKSEQGNLSKETVQVWADSLVANEYADFVNAFKAHFASYNNDFIEINVSAGPSGELRYPSYNAHDQNTGYPFRGSLQSYSRFAVKDFQKAILKKYVTLAGVNAAWGTSLSNVSLIQPPSNADFFFSSGDYRTLRYGQDFIDWYNQSLVDHGKTLISNVISTLGSSFPAATIGYKIPGVHWTMTHPTYPRAAEVAAGLIQTSLDFRADSTGHGYANIVGLAKTLAASGRGIVLHFTCLEMDDQDGPDQYSLAKSLVFWVANEAQRQGVAIKGENALSGGVTSDHGWDNIENAFTFAPYTGFTTLRLGEVASGNGLLRYKGFIRNFSTKGFPSLFVRGTNNDWGTTAMIKNRAVWSVSNITFGSTNNERFKFDVYGDWHQNFGASDVASGIATANGRDIAVEAGGIYTITFDETNTSFAITPSGTSDTWYLRGTANEWGTTTMTPVTDRDTFTVNATFAREDPNPRFKIDHFGNWQENYPDQDFLVDDCARYEIRFNQTNKTIKTTKIEDVTTGACSREQVSLGATYSPKETTFALWSPDTAKVQLWLAGTLYPMTKVPDKNGLTDVYAVTVTGDHHLKPYNFRVNGRVARDPYGVMVEPDTDNNLVINLALTEPAGGWTPRPPLKEREEAVIYEIHIRDFTIDPSSGVDQKKRGKFLGMVQTGTRLQGKATGIDHLKELGVTHVQILPFYDFRACSVNDPPSCYSWGYDPLNFNVPEERYAISANPLERIRELKTMINEFHKAGIRVIMDVVYNHTADGGGTETTFSPITQQYFFGSDLSGTGNAVDDRHPMVSRFIRDSVEFWAREYHVDGFRFDLMGIFSYNNVGEWGRYLNQKFPDANLLLYGEPWRCCGDDQFDSERMRLGTIGHIVDAHVGAFNDQYRKALKGENKSGKGGGYIFNQQDDLFPIRAGSRGAIRASYNPSKVLSNQWDQMFANDPEQTINYISAHDDLVLRDKILAWAALNGATDKTEYLKRIQQFAAGIILTSQGIPFLHGGDEMLRNKQGNPDSYSAPDDVNSIRWQWKIEHEDVVDFHRQAIALRKNHPGFRLTAWDQVNNTLTTNETLRHGVVVNRINAGPSGDSWQDIIIIYNAADNYEYPLPDGTWFVAMEKADPKAGGDRPVTGKVVAEGTAVTVLHR